MRFHVGFSFRPSLRWIKWIGLAIIGLLAFFGIGNHVVLAATLSATPTAVYARSPRVDTYIPEINVTVPADNLINYDGTCFNANWDGETYCGFQVASSPRSLGYRDSIQNARLRWTFATSDMNKCSSSQSITYTFDYYLRNITSGTLPLLWKTQDLYSNFWIRSSQTNYQCSIASRSGNIATITCTLPNPTSNVYVYLDGFTIPYGSVIDNGYYNVGIRVTQYTCGGLDSGEIIQNNNQNTQQIIDSQNEINNNLTDDVVDGALETGNDFFDNFSTNSTQGFRGIITAPIRIFQKMINNDACVPLSLHLNMSDSVHGGSNDLSLPCGNILWDRAPSAVVGLWQTLIGGVLVYRVLADLVKFVNGLLNPEDSKEFVMDL